jgi:hypothetical protein
MDLPALVTIKVSPAPQFELAVRILFGMSKKNDFYYVIFVDANGNAKVSAEELLRQFDETRSMFLMDYVDPRSSFDGRITAEVLSDLDLQRAIAAFELFRGTVAFPKDYERNLGNAASRGQKPDDYSVQVVRS